MASGWTALICRPAERSQGERVGAFGPPSSWRSVGHGRGADAVSRQGSSDRDPATFPCLATDLPAGGIDAGGIVDAVADQAGQIELIAGAVAVEPAMLTVDPAGAAASAGAEGIGHEAMTVSVVFPESYGHEHLSR